MKRAKLILPLLTFIFTSFGVAAFDCRDVINKSYLSPGDSDFQYHYEFKEEGKLILKAITVDHDSDKPKKAKTDKFEGRYKILKKNELLVNIEVDKEIHRIIFTCEDDLQYMGVGPRSNSLKFKEAKPKNHSFSMIDLWPKGSPVIRRILSEKH